MSIFSIVGIIIGIIIGLIVLINLIANSILDSIGFGRFIEKFEVKKKSKRQ